MGKNITDSHRKPSKVKLSKLCVRCFKNDLIDGAEFIRNTHLTKHFKGDICIECQPHLNKEYKEFLKKNKLTIDEQIRRDAASLEHINR